MHWLDHINNMIDDMDIPEFDLRDLLAHKAHMDRLNTTMLTIASRDEWDAMGEAAELAHQGKHAAAEVVRSFAGYHGLGNEKFVIPDQRHLIGNE
jgi:hypothetical protein